MAGPRARADPEAMTDGMADAEAIHLFTALGALCSAPAPYRWALTERRTTCAACRELLRAGVRRPCAAGLYAIRKVSALAKLAGTG
jgi:hypothetical protein